MEAKRDLPKSWHLVGAMGCDFTHNFPPKLRAGPIRAFLDDAQGGLSGYMLVAGCVDSNMSPVDLPATACRQYAE